MTATLAELHADLFTREAVARMAWLRTRVLTAIQYLEQFQENLSEREQSKKKSFDTFAHDFPHDHSLSWQRRVDGADLPQ